MDRGEAIGDRYDERVTARAEVSVQGGRVEQDGITWLGTACGLHIGQGLHAGATADGRGHDDGELLDAPPGLVGVLDHATPPYHHAYDGIAVRLESAIRRVWKEGSADGRSGL